MTMPRSGTRASIGAATARLRNAARNVRECFSAGALILMYHRITVTEPDPWSLCVSPRNFAEHLEVLRRSAAPLALRQLIHARREGKIRRHSIVVTFDDGYADNLYNARPLLERHDTPATVFLTSGYLGAMREFWWDELAHLVLEPARVPHCLHLAVGGHVKHWQFDDASRLDGYFSVWEHLYSLTEPQRQESLTAVAAWSGARAVVRPGDRPLYQQEVAQLARDGLIEIGAHTVTHSSLPLLSEPLQQAEIAKSKADLEALVDQPVVSFSYPHGDYTAETAQLVRLAGFESACTIRRGKVYGHTDPYHLPRMVVGDWDGDEFARRLAGKGREHAL